MSFAAAATTTATLGKSSVLRLYKDLLRYSGRLQFSDKDYYLGRIRKEFRRRQELTNPKDIEFFYKKGISFLTRAKLV